MKPKTSRRVVLCLLVVLCAACVSKPPAPIIETPPPLPPPPKVALVLGGGGARGFAHVGVLKLLDTQGLKPDLIIGPSACSVAGSLYAAGYSGFDLPEMAFARLGRALWRGK